MSFHGQVRQWFAALERSDLSATSPDLSGSFVGFPLSDKSGEVADKSDLSKEIADLDC